MKILTKAAFIALALAAVDLPVYAVEKTKPAKTVDVVCAQTAVNTRDNSLISAVDTKAVSVKAALATRRDALKAAYALTDASARRMAIKAAWNAYESSIKTARSAMHQSRTSAWEKFRTDMKTCNASEIDSRKDRGHDNIL